MLLSVDLAAAILSVALSSVIAYFSARSARTVGEPHLSALPVGFSFLAASQSLTAYWLLYASGTPYGNEVVWMQLLTESYAYAFIALAYYAEVRVLARNYERLLVWGTPLLVLLALLTILAVASPALLAFPSSDVVDEYFSGLDILLLVYIVVRAGGAILRSRGTRHLLFPSGMGLLALSQYTLLIARIEPNQTATYLAYVTRLAGLLLLVLVPLQVFLGQRGEPDEPTV